MRRTVLLKLALVVCASALPLLPATAPAVTNICFVGDSFVTNETITFPLRAWMQQKFGNASVGLVTMNAVDVTPNSVTNVRTGSWTDYQTNATGLNAAYTRNYTDNGTITLNGSAFAGTQFVIHYLGQVSGGTFSYAVDGGTATHVDTSASTGYQTVTAGGFTNGPHTLVISMVPPAAANGVLIYGVSAESPAGVRVHRIGHSGMEAADFAAMDQSIWQAGLHALGCNITILQFGTNEKWHNKNPADMIPALTTLIASAKTANPGSAVMLIAPWDNTILAAYNMGQYEASVQTAAGTNAFMNMYQTMGPPPVNIARNYYADSNPYVHPDTAGGQAWAYQIFKYLLRGPLPR